MEQDILMLIEYTIAKLIVKLEPRLYRKFIWKNKQGKPMQGNQYIRGTREITLTIEPSEHPKWWVESSYTLHPDMGSHSEATYTIH